MRAVKAYAVPESPREAAGFWAETGFDWVMLSPGCLDSPRTAALLKAIRDEGLRWSAIEPVFLADGETEQGELALGQDGKPLSEGWVRFWCPSKEGPRERLRRRLRFHAALGPDGMSLDFLRFWQFWETLPSDAEPSALRRSCFCPDCLRSRGGEGETAWRLRVVNEAARELADLARTLVPGILLGLHAVPWLPGDFGGAVTGVLAQDLGALAPLFDYVTPMAYHHMTGRDPSWIAAVAEDQGLRTGLPVIPSIQTDRAYREEPLPPEEFARAAEIALASSGGNLALYRHEDLARDPEKSRRLRMIFSAWRNG